MVAGIYTLSDNERTLTIETHSKNPSTGETRTTSMYKKK
jgi:hypothetical protein